MTELFGPLPRHDVASLPLIVAALAPLAAAAVTAVGARWFDEDPRREGRPSLAGIVAASGAGVAAVVVGAGLVAAAKSASGLAISPGWALLRVGSIQGAAGFDVDLARGVVALVLTVAAVVHAWRSVQDTRSATATSMAVATALCALLADGLTMGAIALGGALATAAFAGTPGRGVRGAAALGLLMLGGVTLAWGLEGRWLRGLQGEYLSDYGPRFAAVRDAAPKAPRPRGLAAAEGRGTLTMTSTPGADVYVGVADDVSLRTRRAPLATSPFRGVEVPAVLQKVAIVPRGAAVVGGEGNEVALVDAVDVRAGEDVMLLPLGATWTWRDLDAQLALRDADARHPLRSAFAAKRLAGVALPTAVLALLFAAAFAALWDAPKRLAEALARGGRGEAALVAAALGLAACLPAARAGALVPLAGAGALVAIAIALLIAGGRAALPVGSWFGPAAVVLAAGAGLLAVAADARRARDDAETQAQEARGEGAMSSPFAAVAIAAALLALAGDATAHTGAARTEATPTFTTKKPPEGPRGKLEVRAPRGEALRLLPLEGALWGGEIEIANTGDGPLTIERVGFLPGREGAPRTPPGASAVLAKGRDLKLAPGETKRVEVRWRSDLARSAELSGLVEIQSDSASPSASAFDEPALVGVLGDRRSGLGLVLASTLILLPLLVLLLAAGASKIRALGDRGLARAATGIFLVHAALAIVAAAWIDPQLTSLDGNDGVQYLEHVGLPGGLRWSVGIDGASIPFLVATTLVLLGASVAGRRVRLHGRSFFAGLALLATSTTGTLLALDSRLLVAFVALGAPAAFLLVAASSDERARRAAWGAAAIVGASAAVLGAGVWGLAAAAGPGVDLVSGRADATWLLGELARVEWASDARRVVGLHPAVAAWILPITALALRAGLVLPFATGRALEPASAAAAAALLGTSLTGLGLVVVRLSLGPGAIAASSVAVGLVPLGVAIAALGVVDAWRAKDLVRLASASVQVQAGLALAALAARTPQGIAGALATLAWHGMAAALLVLVAGSLRDRVGTSEPAQLGGLRSEMPRAALFAGVAMLAAGGLPGLAGFWGPSLNVAGLAPRTPLLAVAATLVLIVHAGALARAYAQTFHGELSARWKDSKELEPFGGRFPDLRARELLGLAPLAAALLALGLHPRALLAPTEPKLLELHRRVDPASPSQIARHDRPGDDPTDERG